MATFHLKCVVCGDKDERPAAECQGSDNPTCKKCFGPMVLEEAETLLKPAAKVPYDTDWSKPIKVNKPRGGA